MLTIVIGVVLALLFAYLALEIFDDGSGTVCAVISFKFVGVNIFWTICSFCRLPRA